MTTVSVGMSQTMEASKVSESQPIWYGSPIYLCTTGEDRLMNTWMHLMSYSNEWIKNNKRINLINDWVCKCVVVVVHQFEIFQCMHLS